MPELSNWCAHDCGGYDTSMHARNNPSPFLCVCELVRRSFRLRDGYHSQCLRHFSCPPSLSEALSSALAARFFLHPLIGRAQSANNKMKIFSWSTVPVTNGRYLVLARVLVPCQLWSFSIRNIWNNFSVREPEHRSTTFFNFGCAMALWKITEKFWAFRSSRCRNAKLLFSLNYSVSLDSFHEIRKQKFHESASNSRHHEIPYLSPRVFLLQFVPMTHHRMKSLKDFTTSQWQRWQRRRYWCQRRQTNEFYFHFFPHIKSSSSCTRWHIVEALVLVLSIFPRARGCLACTWCVIHLTKKIHTRSFAQLMNKLNVCPMHLSTTSWPINKKQTS